MGRNQFQVLSRERIFFFFHCCYSAAEFVPVHVVSVMFYPVPLQTLINYSWQSASSLHVSAARSDTTQSRSTFVGHAELVCLLDLKINSCFEMQIPMCTKDLWKPEYPFFRRFRWGAVFIQRLGDFCGETVIMCDAGFSPVKHSELRTMSNQRSCITIAHMVYES